MRISDSMSAYDTTRTWIGTTKPASTTLGCDTLHRVNRAQHDDHDSGSTAVEQAAAHLQVRLQKVVPALQTQALRMAFLRDCLRNTKPTVTAFALNELCSKRQAGNTAATDVLLAFTGMVGEPWFDSLLHQLHPIAHENRLTSLLATLPTPHAPNPSRSQGIPDDERRVPDYKRGRILTLGERKALARKTSRALFDKLLSDPNPTVIRHLLNNSVTTEDDVVRLAARRPLSPDVAAEITQHPRWNVRPRVRMALLLNPGCPPELGLPLVRSLRRPDLSTVVAHAGAHPEIRAAASTQLAH